MKKGLGRFSPELTSFVNSREFQRWPRVKEGPKWKLKVELNLSELFFKVIVSNIILW